MAHLKSFIKEDFFACFQKCQERWNKCVNSQVAYFERNNVLKQLDQQIMLFQNRGGYFLNRPDMCQTWSSNLNKSFTNLIITHYFLSSKIVVDIREDILKSRLMKSYYVLKISPRKRSISKFVRLKAIMDIFSDLEAG